MSKTIKIDLPDPVETHSGLISKVEFREPSARDYFSLGDPYQLVRGADGGVFVVEKDDVILSYMERCVQAPVDPIALGAMSLAGAIICREKFLSFFETARARMSNMPVTSSSST